MGRETITIREAARRLGISDGLAYQAARRGELPVIRIGKRYLVVSAQLDAWLARSAKGVDGVGSTLQAAEAGE